MEEGRTFRMIPRGFLVSIHPVGVLVYGASRRKTDDVKGSALSWASSAMLEGPVALLSAAPREM